MCIRITSKCMCSSISTNMASIVSSSSSISNLYIYIYILVYYGILCYVTLHTNHSHNDNIDNVL